MKPDREKLIDWLVDGVLGTIAGKDPVFYAEFPGLPPSLWEAYEQRGQRRFLSKRGRAWKDTASHISLLIHRGKKTIESRTLGVMHYVVPERRYSDIDNRAKLPLDALKPARVWKDDSLVDTLLQGFIVDGTIDEPYTRFWVWEV